MSDVIPFDPSLPQHCCACDRQVVSRNLLMLEDRKAPQPGTGWGCVQCGLSLDGALAALCDDCAANPDVKIRYVFNGYVQNGLLIPIEEAPEGKMEHDMKLHPGEL